MRFIIPEYDFEMELQENEVGILTIENPQVYEYVLGDLWNQFQGELGDCIISDADRQYKISEEVFCIYQVFDLNISDRKIMNQIFKELTENANSQLYRSTSELQTHLINYMDSVIQSVSYHLEYQESLDLKALFKMMGVSVGKLSGTLLERLVDYLSILHRICGISIFVIPNLKYYLSEEELQELYKFARYEKLFLIIIEGLQSQILQYEKSWIFDKDYCIIKGN